ncbi:hypothetical protein DIPPA_02043 [Diplonema papillatum]|nr:hypothetical protein DIPPA_02043 [Diplonema papillatum]
MAYLLGGRGDMSFQVDIMPEGFTVAEMTSNVKHRPEDDMECDEWMYELERVKAEHEARAGVPGPVRSSLPHHSADAAAACGVKLSRSCSVSRTDTFPSSLSFQSSIRSGCVRTALSSSSRTHGRSVHLQVPATFPEVSAGSSTCSPDGDPHSAAQSVTRAQVLRYKEALAGLLVFILVSVSTAGLAAFTAWSWL